MQLKNYLHYYIKKASKPKGNFYCLNCLNSSRTENKLKSRENVYENKVFCGIVVPSEENKVLEFKQYEIR